MHTFEVHSNDSACIKSGRLGLEQFIIIAVASVEGFIIFYLDISYTFQNTILPNPAHRLYISLPYLYLYWYKIKCPKHKLASINQK